MYRLITHEIRFTKQEKGGKMLLYGKDGIRI